MDVAVIGATGAVGREMTRILEERAFPVDRFLPLASARSAGRRVPFRGEDHEVQELSVEAVRGFDLAFASAGASTARAFLREIAAAGTVCIDNSSAFRMDPDVPLAIPPVNPEVLETPPPSRIVAVPNCTTITAMLAVAPLHRAAGLRSLVLSSYQSVSGAGQRGVRELIEQIEKLRGDEASLARPDPATLPVGEVVGTTIAYNVVPRIGDIEPSGFTGEEAKMMAEPRKILGLPDLPVVATSVRVPTIVGHAVSIVATFGRPIDPDEARAVLARAPAVEVRDDPASGVVPTPLEAAGLDVALVGRIRRIPDRPDALALFACADNLRLGAALDAVLIAERLIGR
ncbi:MAG: aspartate-semialdehyde dehydrogenase [Actinomycetota bacterium]|jgi:aspartate-semialdehyde dehydrogenase|nr:MAG: aspartate-semialdehyde dehydrogenase [Actinomycetota bacterium]